MSTETETDNISEQESTHTIGWPSEESCKDSDDEEKEATLNVGAKDGGIKNDQTSYDKITRQKTNLIKKKKNKMRIVMGSCQNRRLGRKWIQEGNLGFRRRLGTH